MDKEEIKSRLARPATRFFAGGFRPTYNDEESWLGKVFLFRPDEGIPRNEVGGEMLPYAQFHLPNLPFCSPALKNTRVLTVFVSEPLPEAFEPMGRNWLIREYGPGDVLVRKDLCVAASHLKPFPLKAEFVAEDYPLWDGGGVPAVLEDEVLKLEREGKLESYYDLVTHAYEHKIGGYPSFCQSGVEADEGYEFMFQISSDAKINLNVVDSGSLMFWKNPLTGDWVMYYDFY
ncbi:DUF1963 domain-containing protein [Pseudomonas sp. SWRI102]|uniref:DUF1963 domain-containing protein n=1 Tax=Pseudomonas marvdashtae TaxID=2745500 RepID=A0A923JQD4_9PSED|nr:DUF1963 domain-containing protein [Pseudomonas marvdashtae]MBV4549539.1 DUF1963 domain-containing protein [Pseudomonas marvdashtae]